MGSRYPRPRKTEILYRLDDRGRVHKIYRLDDRLVADPRCKLDWDRVTLMRELPEELPDRLRCVLCFGVLT